MKQIISLMLIWFAIGTGTTALLGYTIGKEWMFNWDAKTPMAINTAACILALGIAFLLRHEKKHESNH